MSRSEEVHTYVGTQYLLWTDDSAADSADSPSNRLGRGSGADAENVGLDSWSVDIRSTQHAAANTTPPPRTPRGLSLARTRRPSRTPHTNCAGSLDMHRGCCSQAQNQSGCPSARSDLPVLRPWELPLSLPGRDPRSPPPVLSAAVPVLSPGLAASVLLEGVIVRRSCCVSLPAYAWADLLGERLFETGRHSIQLSRLFPLPWGEQMARRPRRDLANSRPLAAGLSQIAGFGNLP